MAKKLKDCFPMIREENELLAEIRESETLRRTFQGWPEEKQRIFLDCCTGVRGVKMLYDSFFKEIMNPEKNPERIEELLSLLLDRQVRILKVLPLEGIRLAGAHSLVIMDIVVELEGGSQANVEVQKLGYRFPGQTGCVAGFPEHGGAGGDPGPSGVLPGFGEALRRDRSAKGETQPAKRKTGSKRQGTGRAEKADPGTGIGKRLRLGCR